MQFRVLLPIISIVIISLTAGCGNEEEPDQQEVYEVQGQFLSTAVDGHSVSVVHETIPEVMDAMRMSLRIDDPALAEELETGDPIQFEMVYDNGQWHIRNITPLPEDTELDLPEELMVQ